MRTMLTCCAGIAASLLALSHAGVCSAGYGTKFENSKDIEVDIKRIRPGHLLQLDWNGHGVMIYRRTTEDIRYLKTNFQALADPYGNELKSALEIAARAHGNAFASLLKPFNESLLLNPLRSANDEFFVASLVSNYIGCAVLFVPAHDKKFGKNWHGGFYDPCREVKYDLSGRVLKGHAQGTNLNLLVIPHTFRAPDKLTVGVSNIANTQVQAIDFRPFIPYSELPPTRRLVLASEFGELKQIELAIQLGADINAYDDRGVTALFMALAQDNFEATEWLLAHGANPNLETRRGFLPSYMATIQYDDLRYIELMGRYGTDWEKTATDPNCAAPRIIWAIQSTGEETASRVIKALLAAGANPGVIHQGKSARDYAKTAKFQKVVELLDEAIAQRAFQKP